MMSARQASLTDQISVNKTNARVIAQTEVATVYADTSFIWTRGNFSDIVD